MSDIHLGLWREGTDTLTQKLPNLLKAEVAIVTPLAPYPLDGFVITLAVVLDLFGLIPSSTLSVPLWNRPVPLLSDRTQSPLIRRGI